MVWWLSAFGGSNPPSCISKIAAASSFKPGSCFLDVFFGIAAFAYSSELCKNSSNFCYLFFGIRRSNRTIFNLHKKQLFKSSNKTCFALQCIIPRKPLETFLDESTPLGFEPRSKAHCPLFLF